MAMDTSKTTQDQWLLRLKSAVDSGYYRTEERRDDQIHFPWQNKTCKDRPYWSGGICRVFAEYRAASAHTCAYFGGCDREAAAYVIRERQWKGYRRWWNWFNSR